MEQLTFATNNDLTPIILSMLAEDSSLPCDDCIYEKCQCCDYPTKDFATDYCIMGDKQKQKGGEN